MKISWKTIKKFDDIRFENGLDDAKHIAKITINRPEVKTHLGHKQFLNCEKHLN